MGSIFSKSFKANANNNNEKICFLQELVGYFPESDKIFERNTNLQGLAVSGHAESKWQSDPSPLSFVTQVRSTLGLFLTWCKLAKVNLNPEFDGNFNQTTAWLYSKSRCFTLHAREPGL